MVAYRFQKRFAPLILARTKTQTIRGHRKRHARQGEELQLYTGMRTSFCQLIGKPTCSGVSKIHLSLFPSTVASFVQIHRWNGSVSISGDGLQDFAKKDGFNNWRDMVDFWQVYHQGAHEFDGVLIEWDPETLTA